MNFGLGWSIGSGITPFEPFEPLVIEMVQTAVLSHANKQLKPFNTGDIKVLLLEGT